MIFQALSEAADRGELIIIEDAICRFYVRKDGVLVIREILVLPASRRQGIGNRILCRLIKIADEQSVHTIRAKCPADLPANNWYDQMGFILVSTQDGKRTINTWELSL